MRGAGAVVGGDDILGIGAGDRDGSTRGAGGGVIVLVGAFGGAMEGSVLPR